MRIALIHATALAVEPIRQAFERHWPQAVRMNLLDDSLSVDRARDGGLTPAMQQRFVDLALYAQRAGCQGVLFTCSAFGPAIDAAAAATGLPTLKPNEAMFVQGLEIAAGKSGRLGLVATFEASLQSMATELEAMARAAGLQINLTTALAEGAMQDLAMGRVDAHHRKVAQAAASLQDCDAVMLAQFSMADAQATTQSSSPCPVLSSPDCAVLAMKEKMNHWMNHDPVR